ncbi:Uncharacterized protein FKW44_012228, partial [Caligus rogercresseyi]
PGDHRKSDLEDHLAKTEALPNTQFGFKKSRSTTAVLATAHAKWLEAEQRGKVVGVLGFDLSAAFDTVNQLQLLPSWRSLGLLVHSLSGSTHTSLAGTNV